MPLADSILQFLEDGRITLIASTTENPYFSIYKYPHDYANHYVEQQYMPDNLKDRIYYQPGNNKYEKSIENYWKSIKGK